jgi:hypothetical protein
MTISDWRQKGLIRAHAMNGRTQLLFKDPGPHSPKKNTRKFRAGRPDWRSAVIFSGQILALWKDSDPDIPIFKQAKAEHAKLN